MQRYNRTEPITKSEIQSVAIGVGHPLMHWQLEAAAAILNCDNVMILHPRLTSWRSVQEVVMAFDKRQKET